MSDRVIVAIPSGVNQPVAVFDSWEGYDEWIEDSKYEDDAVLTYDCNVRQT